MANQRSGSMLLAALLILGIAIRYPTSYFLNEAGADASYYGALAQTVFQYGRAPWTVSPLSYAGLYPFSEGSAIPILGASVMHLGNLPMDAFAFFSAEIVTFATALAIFLTVWRATRSHIGGLVATFAFVSSPILLFYSSNTLATRYYEVAWAASLLLAINDWRRTASINRAIVVGLIGALTITTHLSFLLVLLLVLGSFLLGRIDRIWRAFRPALIKHRPIRIISRWYYAAFLGCFLGLVAATLPVTEALQGSSVGLETYDIGVFSGSSLLASYANLAASTIGGAGLLAAGLFLLAPRLWQLSRRQVVLPLLAAILLASLLVAFRLYARPLVALILCLSAGLGARVLLQVRESSRIQAIRKLAAPTLVALCVATCGVTYVVVNHWHSAGGYYVTEPAYSTFLYIKMETRGNLLCNQYPSDRFLTAYSGKFCSPSLPGSGLEMVPLMTGAVDWAGLVIQPTNLSSLLSGGASLALYQVVGYDPNRAYFQLVGSNSVSSSQGLLGSYQVSYVLEYRPLASNYAIRWNLQTPTYSPFLAAIADSSYATYEDGSYVLRYV